MKDCEHKNRAYSSQGITLTSYPAINISYWICKDCGFEGQDSVREPMPNQEYEETKRKFNS